ncbi:MAG: toxin Bro [Lactobacillus sp.]|nr:MAG: toxin Bro [Lactobacillus sp.]
MNELIKTYTNDDGVTVVDGRSLHEFLEVKTAYKDWFPRMVEYGFTEGTDFSSYLSTSNGGRPQHNHIVTMDMAKELSMIQRSEKGKQARQYFISMEKQAQVLPQTPEEKIDLLIQNSKNANDKIKAVSERIDQLEDDRLLAPGEYSFINRQVQKAVREYIIDRHLKLTQKQRGLLHKDISNGLNAVTGIRTRTQLREKDFNTACDYIDNWSPSTATMVMIRQLDAEAIADQAMGVS